MPTEIVKWTKEAAMSAASGYTDRGEFTRDHGGAVVAARRDGYYEEMMAHMPYKFTKWDYDKVKEVAANYTVPDHFAREYPGAMKWAKRHGVYEEVCSHMTDHRRGDFDAVYIWKLKDFGDVYKVGVTSHRLQDKRIRFVSQMSGYDVDYYFVVKSDKACQIESEMLSLGKPFHGVDCNGMTEFREFTPEEFDMCLSLMGVTKTKRVMA